MAETVSHVEKKSVYVKIWAALLCLTALTTGVAFIDLGAFNTVAAFAIAICKALLVVFFFMHLRHSERLVRIVAIAAAFWLAILIVISLSDFATRGLIRTPTWPQNRPPVVQHLKPGPTL